MYAGTTIRHGSGKIVGVHQKIDRAARRKYKSLPKTCDFPGIKEILYFEGNNGPDGLKRKSPSVDEPWHYIDPNVPGDSTVLTEINDHIFNLTQALKNDNVVRASFEAAWLAHTIVDGLTPSHHYPMGDKIQELWGKPHSERSSILEKTIIIGDSSLDSLSKNWEYWGPGGVFTTHYMFEWGVATSIASESFKDIKITRSDIDRLKRDGFEKVYLKSLHKIDSLKMYDKFGEKGWTRPLAKQTREVLVPEMVRMVTLAWYCAAIKVKNK